MSFDVPSHFGGDEDFPYDVENDFWGFTEHLDDYKPGGLHPIILGDRLGDNGRFRVAHKLGHGGYGTVWLCQDTLSSPPKWRAVKVMSAKESRPNCAELRAMEAFGDINSSTIESDFHVSAPLEHFWIDGPNGRHLALVFVLCADTANGMFSIYGHNRALVKDLCFQLAKSLQLIHSRGLCHGDFRPENILVRLCDGVDCLSEESLLKSFNNGGKPDTVRIISLEDEKLINRASVPSVPEQIVSRATIGFHSGVCAASLAITDFGVSYSPLDPPQEGATGIPLDYASPEERFRQRELLGPSSDIWALGCCILNLALNFTPFAHIEEGDDDDVHAAKMEDLMGPMPEPFRAVYKEEHKQQPKWRCFNVDVANSDEIQDGELKPITEVPPIRPSIGVEEKNRMEAVVKAETSKKSECVMRPGQDKLMRRMMAETGFSLTKEEVEEMTKQWELWQQKSKDKKVGQQQLPFSEERRKGMNPDYDRYVRFTPDKNEVDELFDLLGSIFKWHPKDRATIEQVLNHPWFEGRNRHTAKVPSPVTTKKSVVDEAIGSVKSYLYVNVTSRWAQGLS
ncbi:kinase-like domain-containing protein [Neurospora hispaniola]|uniref:EKC/KEOPS complex subunit BUD32 n=1 Tax=Neurospora hispaniola TaxID=588809 RepID=A0AAJ0I902_9PEZI|nr:kinase-like domain-containing protein [Neurospora hispaniola]